MRRNFSMDRISFPKGENLFAFILVLPFSITVLLLIFELLYSIDIYLDTSINFNPILGIVFSIIHSGVILWMKKLDKFEIEFPKSKIKKNASIIMHIVLLVGFNFMFSWALKMNLNIWLKSNKIEILKIAVIDKHISHGRATDYYIDFRSEKGEFRWRVNPRIYSSYKIGESFNASLQKGYFQGYFLAKPLK